MKILLAYDGFEYSRHALEEAAKLAAEEDSTVTVVGVIPPTARGTKSGGHVDLPPHADEDIAIAHDFLRERGIEADSKIRHGDPADELIAEAREGDYDVAVAGSRGYGPLGQLVHGSVSRKLVKGMPCPVIVAGPEATERHEPEVRAGSRRGQ
jgi:nucleotide-binding universal stress UspA family protein